MPTTVTPQSETSFDLLPGKSVDIQINHPVIVRLKVQLVGYDFGNYIILKYPNPKQGNSYRDVLIEGNVVIVRYLVEGKQGQCFAFRSTIRNITKYPEAFLILNYPKRIENRDLRMHQRHVTHLPAVVMLNDNATGDGEDSANIKGIISDISAKGCGFEFKSNNPKVKVKKRVVTIQIQSSTDTQIKLQGEVCNSRYENGKVSVGIKFDENDKQVKSVIENLFIDAGLE